MTIVWRVLSGVTASTDAGPVDLRQRPRTVLLRLLNDPNRSVSWEALADFVWADDPPKTQRNSIARFVADLRTALGPNGDRIVTVDGGYRVDVRDNELDRDAAQASLSEAKRLAATNVEAAHQLISSAFEIVGTEPNPWLADLPSGGSTLYGNEELQIQVLDVLADLKLRSGRHTELIPLLEQGVGSHPYNESLWAHLILALHRSGRSAEALRTCQRVRGELGEIGLDPSDTINRLESRILAGGSATREVTLDETRGRAADLELVESAASAHRLVSIVGIAGSGKSTLAAAVRHNASIDGVAVYAVDLRAITDTLQVVPTIASAVGIPASQGVADASALAQQLSMLSCLITLDNCEHLRATCVNVVDAVRDATEGVRFLTTSHEPLRAEGEHVYRLGMLSTSGESPAPATDLFIEHASAHLRERELRGEHLSDIETMVGLLHGHPLAIELAAGLLFDSSIADLRLDVEGAAIESPANAIDSTLNIGWAALTTTQQALLARLSVLKGGCSLAAADDIYGGHASVADDLSALVERGLIVHTNADRYEMSTPVREFAARRLSDRRETTVILDRLVSWLRGLTASWGIAEIQWSAEAAAILLPEKTNLLVGLDHLLDRDNKEELAWLAVRAHGLWLNHGMVGEALRWLGPIVEDKDVSRPARSAAAMVLLEADLTLGKLSELAAHGLRVLELADGEPHDWVPSVAGFLAMFGLVFPLEKTTEELLSFSEDMARRSDSVNINMAMLNTRRAQIAHIQRDYDDAAAYFQAAIELTPYVGRALLAMEMGISLSLYLGKRKDEALESVRRWDCTPDVDEWHYMVHVVRAIVVGGCGQPNEATDELATALRSIEPIKVWALADDFQIAFGLLADMRGEKELSAALLATPLSGSVFLGTVIIEHVVESRGLDKDGFVQVAEELMSRAFPEVSERGAITTRSGLVNWWETGVSEPAST